MRRAGRLARYVFGLWNRIAMLNGLAAAVAAPVLRRPVPAVRGIGEAFTAGAALALRGLTSLPFLLV